MYLLIDGSNLVHRSLHATYKNKGTYSYLEAIPHLMEILEKYTNYYYDHCSFIFAWDKGLPLFRRELYSEYKPDSTPLGNVQPFYLSKVNLDPEASYRTHHSNKDFQEEYTKAVNILSRVIIPSCNCLSIRVENCEADDIIAWICYNFPRLPKCIISSDRDLLQLITDTTSVYSFNNQKEYDTTWVTENYENIDQFRFQYLLEKAILGDESDNIPKIESISDRTVGKYSRQILHIMSSGKDLKTALALVQKPERATNKGCDNLRKGYELIRRNMSLMDLYYPIEKDLDYVKAIKNQFLIMKNFKPEYFSAIEKIEQVEGLHFTCANIAGKIFRANCSIDRWKDILNEIK